MRVGLLGLISAALLLWGIAMLFGVTIAEDTRFGLVVILIAVLLAIADSYTARIMGRR